jgi:hypothetical protein
LKAVAGVREFVDKRFALVQEAIADKSDIEQIRETTSDELSHAVQERLKVTVQREIVNAIREEVTRTVQQQVTEVVHREVKSVAQREVTNIVDEKVAAIIQQQVTSIVKEQVTTHDSSSRQCRFSIRRLMSRSLRFLQLNEQKRQNVQHSVMNDVNLKEYAALMISEPYVFEMDGKVTTSPMGHQGWTVIPPSKRHDGRWAVRSMLWVRKDVECEQVDVPSADLTVALLRLPDRSVLLAPVYVEGSNVAALSGTMSLLNEAIHIAQRRGSLRLDVVVAGDFDRHDQLWGGDEVRPQRQGEADPIIDFMNKWSLESLLPRGTPTWQNGIYATTIDLMLASQELASSVLKCKIHDTEHGSDHRAIETSFDVDVPEHTTQPPLLFKNAPWNAIREQIAHALHDRPACGDVRRQTDHLMQVVL